MNTTLRSLSLLLLLCAVSAFAQVPTGMTPNQLSGGLGLTWINGDPYYSVRLKPDVSFGQVGVGLDLNLEFDSQGKLRKEDFNDVSDYISVIRYVRYGTEFDPFFLKLGALDYVTLGHGSIINQYNNSPAYDTRKTGMQMNLNFDKGGIQTIYSNFGQAGVAGIRGYVRPLQFTSMTDLPIISDIEVGATYATDFDKYARVDSVSAIKPAAIYTNGAMSIYGADIDFPLLRTSITGIDLYADYAKIQNFGSGTAAGLSFRFDFTELLKVRTKLERRFNGEGYVPGYFGSMYEIQRFNLDTTGVQNKYSAQYRYLSLANGSQNGVYGDLLINVIGTFDIFGSFQKLDNIDNTGILHLTTDISPPGSPYIARAGYDKIGIQDFKDAVTTDDRSYLYAEAGYKPIPYMIVSMRYSWSFTPVRQGDDIVGYEPQRKIEPRVTFVYDLP